MNRLACLIFCSLLVCLPGFGAEGATVVPPKPIDPSPPAYPAHLREQGIVGKVNVLVTVNEQGTPGEPAVDFASLAEFGPPALAAVATWKFSPTLVDGKPVSRRIMIPIGFNLPDAEIDARESERLTRLPASSFPLVGVEATDLMPELTKPVRPQFPAQIMKGSPSGEALVGLVVDELGQVLDVHLITTTHPAYGEESVRAIQQWKFSPGRVEGQAVRTYLRVIMNFSPDDPRRAGPRIKPGVLHYLEERDDKRYPDVNRLAKVVMPKPTQQQAPEYPGHLARIAGQAIVVFVINTRGVVTHVRCVKATHPSFALEAERAISYWRFKPATLDGQPISVRGHQLLEFRP